MLGFTQLYKNELVLITNVVECIKEALSSACLTCPVLMPQGNLMSWGAGRHKGNKAHLA